MRVTSQTSFAVVWWRTFLIGLIVFVTRIPFLFHGPGRDPDAWKIVITARRLALDGQYEVSRFPGNPLVELAMSPLAAMPLWSYGMLTAIVSAIGAGFLYVFLLDRTELAGRKVILIFALPIVLIESVTAMDYMWSLSFGIAALYLISKRMMFLAGVALGFAIAARLTGCLFIPVAILLFLENSPNRRAFLRATVLVSVGTIITAALYFALPYSVYGWGFLRFYDVAYPNSHMILYRTTFAFGGMSGTVITGCLLLYSCVCQFQSKGTDNRWLSYSALCGAALYGMLFLRAPFESAYLIPCVFFVFLHAAIWVPSRRYELIVGLVVLNGLVDLSPPANGWGNVIQIQSEKAAQKRRVIELSEKLDQLLPNDVLIAGYLEPSIIAVSPGRFQHNQVKYYIDMDAAEQVRSRGGTLYFVRELEHFIESDSRIILEDFAARPL